ncbi:MAG: hypothetical protein K7J15_04950, partial [Candidatus Regiella insecticola]|nr:hypothetical protein [Candidatus Regiella insecticola]
CSMSIHSSVGRPGRLAAIIKGEGYNTDPALPGARNPHVLSVNESCCAQDALASHHALQF